MILVRPVPPAGCNKEQQRYNKDCLRSQANRPGPNSSSATPPSPSRIPTREGPFDGAGWSRQCRAAHRRPSASVDAPRGREAATCFCAFFTCFECCFRRPRPEPFSFFWSLLESRLRSLGREPRWPRWPPFGGAVGLARPRGVSFQCVDSRPVSVDTSPPLFSPAPPAPPHR